MDEKEMKFEAVYIAMAAALLAVGVCVFDSAVFALRVAAVEVAVGAGALAAILWRV